ncbi:MAG TPA: hypothetical protein VFA62_04490 [Acidimicrobiia bacterium]|nr:hypothetical protein [Acidimicrobiia bacterium]
MRRLGAAIAAVLLVVAAILIRNNVIEGDGSGGGGVRLLCASELEAACTDLADHSDVSVTVEPAGVTARSLVALPGDQRPDFDAWLVPSPWPQMVDVQRRAEEPAKTPLFAKPSDPIGRSPLVLVARADRAPVLQATPECNAKVDWKCIGAVAGRAWTDLPGGQAAWGTVKPGPGDPTVSATALLVASQATSEFLDKIDYAKEDLDSDQYLDWVNGIERAVPKLPPTAGSPFAAMVQQLPTATYDVVGTAEEEAAPGIADAAPDRRRALTLLYPEPVVTADVVLAAVAADPRKDDAESLTGDLAAPLARQGWRVPGQPAARGVRDTPALPRSSGLPSDPGALVALQETWGGIPK